MSWFVPPIVVAGRAVGSRTAWPRRSSTARLVREHRRGVLGFDVRHGMRTTLVADQERVAIGEVARTLRLAVRGDEAAVGVVGKTRSDAFGDDAA